MTRVVLKSGPVWAAVRGITLKAAVEEVVERSVSLASMRCMGSRERDPQTGRLKYRGVMSDAVQGRIRAEIWDSKDGEALRALARSPLAGLEKFRAIACIEADEGLRRCHARGLEVLKRGRIGLGS